MGARKYLQNKHSIFSHNEVIGSKSSGKIARNIIEWVRGKLFAGGQPTATGIYIGLPINHC